MTDEPRLRMNPSAIRLLIVEDDEAVQDGAAIHFSRYDDFIVVGQATNVAEAREVFRVCQPAMILVDLCLPARRGVTARNQRHVRHGVRFIRELRRNLPEPQPIIIAFTTSGLKHPEVVLNTVRAGVDGYIVKDDYPSSEERVALMRRAAKGEFMPVSTLVDLISKAFPHLDHPRTYFERLTDREEEVLRFLEEGYSADEIGQKLKISRNVAHQHTGSIRAKLKAEHKNDLDLGR